MHYKATFLSRFRSFLGFHGISIESRKKRKKCAKSLDNFREENHPNLLNFSQFLSLFLSSFGRKIEDGFYTLLTFLIFWKFLVLYMSTRDTSLQKHVKMNEAEI